MTRSKISEVYRSRLSKLDRDQNTRAVLVLGTPRRSLRGLSSTKRQEVLEKRLKQTQATIAQIDTILSEHGGRRVKRYANRLGTVIVEATPPAIIALSDLEQVEAIMEDQKVKGLDLNPEPS